MNRTKRRGLCQALRRREYGKPATQDRNYLLSLGEDITATSCYRNKKCDLPGNPRATFLICFNRDRSRVASTHGDHTVRVSDCRTGRCTHTLTGHPRTPWCIQFHPSTNDLLASGCLGGQVRIWDLVGGGSEVFNPPEKAVIASLAFHPVDKVLLIATGTKLYLWNWDHPTPSVCLQTASSEEKVRLVRFSPLGDKILTGVTNTALRHMTDATAALQNDPASMNRLLQSVSCSRMDSNQIADYLLRPTSSSTTSVGVHLQAGASSSTSVGVNMQAGAPSSTSVGVHLQAGSPSSVTSTSSNVTSFDIPSREFSANSPSNLSRETPSTSSSGDVTTHSHSNQPGVQTGQLDNNSGSLPFACNDVESSSSSDASNPSSSLSSSTIHEPTSCFRHSTFQADPSANSSMSPNCNDVPRRSCSRISGSSVDAQLSDSTRQHNLHGHTDRHPCVHMSNERTVTNQQTNYERSSHSTMNSTPDLTSNSSYVRDSSRNHGSFPGTRPSTAPQETQENASVRNNQQNAGGIIAIFRPREGNNWNLDTQEVETEADFASTATDSQGHDVSDSMSFGRIQQDSDVESVTSASTDFGNVLLRTRAFTSELRPNLTSTHETVTITNQEDDRDRDSNSPQGEHHNGTVRINAADEGVTGMGAVFNVGHNTNPTNQPSGINTSTSSTASTTDSSGTAIATATARTLRHVHTAVVVAEGSNGGPQLALTMAINRAIAGAFAGSGEGAVASNIINTTHRLQWWNFSELRLPDLKKCDENVVCSSCKIHNDASVDVASDASMLATFVPSPYGFPNDGVLAIFSLHSDTLGQCVFRKKFGPNAISVSLSPLNRYVMVGLAARRLHWHLTSRQLIAHIFKLETSNMDQTPDTMKPVHCVIHDCEPDRRSHLSVNAAFWHPVVGCGLVYGTNRGHLCMCEIGPRIEEKFASLRRGSYS